MNKIYDKLLLAIAVLMLAGGVFLYMQKSGQAPESGQGLETATADNPYQPKPIPSTKVVDASWPEPVENQHGWLYDVFTPPGIYRDRNSGELSNEPWKPPVPKPPFGIYLAEIMQKPYRIQLEGYIEEDTTDSSKTLLLLFNEEAQKQVRARINDELPELEFKVLDVEVKRVVDESGGIKKVAKAVILDERTNEEVTLFHAERLYYDEVTVVIRSDEDPSFEKVFTEVPADFEGPVGQYTLKEINLEDSSIKVEKKAFDDFEAEIIDLEMAKDETPAPTDDVPNQVPETGTESILDSIFN